MVKSYQIVVSAAQLGLGGGKAILMQFLSHLQKNVGNNHYDRFVHHSLTELPSIPGVTYHRLDVSHILERYYYDRKGYKKRYYRRYGAGLFYKQYASSARNR